MNKRAIRLKSPRYALFVRSLVAIKKTKWTGLPSRELNSIPCPEIPKHAIISVTPEVWACGIPIPPPIPVLLIFSRSITFFRRSASSVTLFEVLATLTNFPRMSYLSLPFRLIMIRSLVKTSESFTPIPLHCTTSLYSGMPKPRCRRRVVK